MQQSKLKAIDSGSKTNSNSGVMIQQDMFNTTQQYSLQQAIKNAQSSAQQMYTVTQNQNHTFDGSQPTSMVVPMTSAPTTSMIKRKNKHMLDTQAQGRGIQTNQNTYYASQSPNNQQQQRVRKQPNFIATMIPKTQHAQKPSNSQPKQVKTAIFNPIGAGNDLQASQEQLAQMKLEDGQKRISRAGSQQRGQKVNDQIIEYCDPSVQIADRLPQGKSNVKVLYTEDGFEVCNTVLGRYISDNKRYINPKMENELKVFKKKIAYRYENKEISDLFEFPRYQTHLIKVKTPQDKSNSRNKTQTTSSRSQERKQEFQIIEVVDLNYPLNRCAKKMTEQIKREKWAMKNLADQEELRQSMTRKQIMDSKNKLLHSDRTSSKPSATTTIQVPQVHLHYKPSPKFSSSNLNTNFVQEVHTPSGLNTLVQSAASRQQRLPTQQHKRQTAKPQSPSVEKAHQNEKIKQLIIIEKSKIEEILSQVNLKSTFNLLGAKMNNEVKQSHPQVQNGQRQTKSQTRYITGHDFGQSEKVINFQTETSCESRYSTQKLSINQITANGARKQSSSQQRKQSAKGIKVPVKNIMAQQMVGNQYRTIQPSVMTSQVGTTNYSQVHANKVQQRQTNQKNKANLSPDIKQRGMDTYIKAAQGPDECLRKSHAQKLSQASLASHSSLRNSGTGLKITELQKKKVDAQKYINMHQTKTANHEQKKSASKEHLHRMFNEQSHMKIKNMIGNETLKQKQFNQFISFGESSNESLERYQKNNSSTAKKQRANQILPLQTYDQLINKHNSKNLQMQFNKINGTPESTQKLPGQFIQMPMNFTSKNQQPVESQRHTMIKAQMLYNTLSQQLISPSSNGQKQQSSNLGYTQSGYRSRVANYNQQEKPLPQQKYSSRNKQRGTVNDQHMLLQNSSAEQLNRTSSLQKSKRKTSKHH